MLRAAELICAGALIIVGGSSWLAYSGDSRKRYTARKTERIPSVPGARFIIGLCFHATIVITALCLAAPNATALLRLWRPDATLVAGAIVALLGEAVFLAAKFSLGPNYSPCYDAYVPTSVTARGVYRISRHPLYLGNTLVFCGAFLASGSLWALCLLALIVGLYAKTITLEERHLGAVPGYTQYRERTPMLIGVSRSALLRR